MAGDGLGPSTPDEQKGFDNAETGYWTGQLKEWLDLYQRQVSGDILSPAEQKRYLELNNDIADFEKNQPDKFGKVFNAVKTTTQATTDVNGDGKIDSGDLASILSSTFNQTTNTTKRSNEVQNQTAVNYIDLPTPEEFLDDFQNAYNIHITGLVQTGAIRPEVADFARSMMGDVFGQYLRQQTANLLKGIPLYRVVGTDANNQLVGSRTGRQITSNDQTSSTQTQQSTRSESQTGSSGASSTGAGQAVDQAASSTGTLNDTLNENSDFKLNEQEALVSRNKLNYVNSLAPLDFLKDAANAQTLNQLYGGYKGTAQRQAQTASGGDVGGVRRI